MFLTMADEPDSQKEGCCVVNERLSDYKSRTWKNNQETRRNRLLEEQKRRRENSFNVFRDFSDVFNSNDDNDFNVEDMETCEDDSSGGPTFPRLKDLFMFSEWMTELPFDLHENWIFMPCPVGKRCLVRSCKGSTVVYGKRGYRMARFRSALPNGGHESSHKHKKSDVTVLDCIWSGSNKMYYILDVLYWKNQSYLNTDIAFRSFWIMSKLQEIPGITEKSDTNPYPFVPLSYHNCDTGTISAVMSTYPYFKSCGTQIDGILFYHKEGYYTPGTTPLVLWLKPYMLTEILGQDVYVADDYYRSRPASYTDMFNFIIEYEESQKEKLKSQKWRRRRKKNADAVDDMDICGSETVDDYEFC